MNTKHTESPQVLMFIKDGTAAFIVTDGHNTRSYEENQGKAHASLIKAIAYMEVKGFRIVPDGIWI